MLNILKQRRYFSLWNFTYVKMTFKRYKFHIWRYEIESFSLLIMIFIINVIEWRKKERKKERFFLTFLLHYSSWTENNCEHHKSSTWNIHNRKRMITYLRNLNIEYQHFSPVVHIHIYDAIINRHSKEDELKFCCTQIAFIRFFFFPSRYVFSYIHAHTHIFFFLSLPVVVILPICVWWYK